jgi:hypothetical protein
VQRGAPAEQDNVRPPAGQCRAPAGQDIVSARRRPFGVGQGTSRAGNGTGRAGQDSVGHRHVTGRTWHRQVRDGQGTGSGGQGRAWPVRAPTG